YIRSCDNFESPSCDGLSASRFTVTEDAVLALTTLRLTGAAVAPALRLRVALEGAVRALRAGLPG
ncbi:MAG: hypothetical protein ACPGVY_00280, partial [Mycobacterium sp.]